MFRCARYAINLDAKLTWIGRAGNERAGARNGEDGAAWRARRQGNRRILKVIGDLKGGRNDAVGRQVD